MNVDAPRSCPDAGVSVGAVQITRRVRELFRPGELRNGDRPSGQLEAVSSRGIEGLRCVGSQDDVAGGDAWCQGEPSGTEKTDTPAVRSPAAARDMVTVTGSAARTPGASAQAC